MVSIEKTFLYGIFHYGGGGGGGVTHFQECRKGGRKLHRTAGESSTSRARKKLTREK